MSASIKGWHLYHHSPPFLPQLIFFSQLLLRNPTVFSFTSQSRVCIVCFCSFSNFPQDSSMHHYQVKSGGAEEIHRHRGCTHTQRHTHFGIHEGWLLSTSSSTVSQSDWGAEQRRNQMHNSGWCLGEAMWLYISVTTESIWPFVISHTHLSHIIVSHFVCHSQLKHTCQIVSHGVTHIVYVGK